MKLCAHHLIDLISIPIVQLDVGSIIEIMIDVSTNSGISSSSQQAILANEGIPIIILLVLIRNLGILLNLSLGMNNLLSRVW